MERTVKIYKKAIVCFSTQGMKNPSFCLLTNWIIKANLLNIYKSNRLLGFKSSGVFILGNLRVRLRSFSGIGLGNGVRVGVGVGVGLGFKNCRRVYSSTSVECVTDLNKESLNKRLKLVDLGYIPSDIFNYNPLDSYLIIEGVLKDIGGINRKGFVNNVDIFNVFDYPVLGKFSMLFIKKSKDKGLEDKIDLGLVSLEDKIDLGKWSYNLIMLELLYILELGFYKINIEIDKNRINDLEGNPALTDLLENYKVLIKVVMSKIEPSIKHKIQKGGITVIHNTYTGYDSEFQNIDLKYNELLSVQLAVNTKTSLKMPLVNKYEFSKVDTLSGKVYPITTNAVTSIDYFTIERLINDYIKRIRFLKYNSYDISISKIITSLKEKRIPSIEVEGKDSIIFSFDRTPITTWIKLVDGEGFTFKELVRKSNDIAQPKHELEWSRILNILKDIHNDKDFLVDNDKDFLVDKSLKITDLVDNIKRSPVVEIASESGLGIDSLQLNKRNSKQFIRTRMQSFSNNVVSVTEIKNNYFIGHLTSADLSILKDFSEIKDSLDIVNGCFVTIGKPIQIEGVNVSIRDTMLLAPGSKKSLAAIGSLYDDKLNKKSIGDRVKNMKLFKEEDPVAFEEYALQDALITLIHASFMEDFNFSIGSMGIPLTLSTLSRNYILNKWSLTGYLGYQITPEFLVGDAFKGQTPKGLDILKTIGIKMSLYIANYKGGRNESFMYGIDNEIKWFDYDLTSAYTTGMAMLGDPNYKEGITLKEEDFLKMSKESILYSYTVIKCTFKFPASVKYPSIPCYLDKTTTVYALEGSAILTGAEYLLAISQDCKIKIEEIYHIPFRWVKKSKDEYRLVKPFGECIKELQGKRVTYPKGSINNLIYKDIGNSIYGLTVKGISNNMKYDIKSKQTVRMNSGILSNPIIASWTTAFIRSVIGELLHKIQGLGGKVVSVTTDGFITDIENLETVLKEDSFSLFNEYKKMREELSGNDSGLELKKTTKGIVSWSTRGQFSKEGGLKAITGFQSKGFKDFNELDILLKDTLNSEEKKLEFIQTSLRSALDIYKKGGHVTSTYTDRIFRMWYDNRRTIIIPTDLEAYFSDNVKVNYTNILLDSKPLSGLTEGKLYRFYGNLNKTVVYEKKSSGFKTNNVYKSYLELAIRNFLKGLMNNSYNLDSKSFDNYNDIIEYIHKYNPLYKLTPNLLAQIKRKSIIKRPVEKTNETLDFVKYVKTKFPNFDEGSFFK